MNFSLFFFVFLLRFFDFNQAHNIRLTNNCNSTIWPAWRGIIRTPHGGGTTLESGQSIDFKFPDTWIGGGVFWARTGCDDNFNCETGGCGNHEQCNGIRSELGVTIAILVNNTYTVAVFEGFNIQIQVKPHNGTGDCKAIGECNDDVIAECPTKLRRVRNGRAVECLGPCTALRKEKYCCFSHYYSPDKCKPSKYSRFFKERCPTVVSYMFDDVIDKFTCKDADYEIVFC